MTVEKFREVMKYLDLKHGDSIEITYSCGNQYSSEDKSVRGNFVGITPGPSRRHLANQRIEWIEDGRLKSLSHRKVIILDKLN